MKVLAFLGSPRNGNTTAMVNAVCKGAAGAGHETEIINLASLKISDCTACCACKSDKFTCCAIKDDMQELYTKIIEADCLVFG
ncbi:flavodoxin family protein, partial [Klebsiella pneumoniae]|nr:flavodoxin family protein [Klebsiella pneumoniae]